MPINHSAQKAIYTSEKPVEVIEKRRERLQKNCEWGRQRLSRPKLLDYGASGSFRPIDQRKNQLPVGDHTGVIDF